jgi:hypothetical protein
MTQASNNLDTAYIKHGVTNAQKQALKLRHVYGTYSPSNTNLIECLWRLVKDNFIVVIFNYWKSIHRLIY